MSFSRSVVIVHCLIALGSASCLEKVSEIVCQGEKLEPHRIVSKVVTGEPRPLHRVFAFLNALLRCPALVVEVDDVFRSHREIRNDEADSGEKFPAMPFHFRDHTPGMTPSCGLVHEVVVSNDGRLRRATHGSDKELLDLAPENIIRGQADCVAIPFRFEVFVNVWIGKRRITTKQQSDIEIPVACDDRLEYRLPVLRTVDVPLPGAWHLRGRQTG